VAQSSQDAEEEKGGKKMKEKHRQNNSDRHQSTHVTTVKL